MAADMAQAASWRLPSLALVAWAALASAASAGAAETHSDSQATTFGCVSDDLAQEVCLSAPAQRIIALSPNLVELVYAVGAGSTLVGAVSYSDYPAEASALPRVGDSDRMDIEAILSLSPDLVLAWHGGNPRMQVDKLVALGIPVYTSDAQDFPTIASTLERFGQLTGHTTHAETAAQQLREGVAELEQRYQDAPTLSVFYQVWDKPLMTVNGEHWISQSLAICGAESLFADADALVPRPSIENVLAADPDVIITGGKDASDTAWHSNWLRFPQLSAVRHDNLFVVDPDLVQRATPRLLEGTRELCQRLDDARERR
ncbi:cobalamin-binding protein [Halomonas halocynthiae]|uniref:cobalamin-binding protein n=1 Tax=Halomonas halocynthiae TaxID=176290 RepID=UPI000403DA70|nr:cobalamin-binding protein [Halomonas halocynthiae]